MRSKRLTATFFCVTSLALMNTADACWLCRVFHRGSSRCDPCRVEVRYQNVCEVQNAHTKCGFCTWKWKKSTEKWEHEKKSCKDDCRDFDCKNLDPNDLNPVPVPTHDAKRLKIPCEFSANAKKVASYTSCSGS